MTPSPPLLTCTVKYRHYTTTVLPAYSAVKMENNERNLQIGYNPQYGSVNTGSVHPDTPHVRYHNHQKFATYCTWGLLAIVCFTLLLPAVWIFIHHAIIRHWFLSFLIGSEENFLAPSRIRGFNVSETQILH
uniref:Uncharacterized protein n=1 Tax=Cuerna arida TaxID=1464854 RepID=A0A1B6EPH2_9HEMI